MAITQLRGKTQIKDQSIDRGRLELDFLAGLDLNLTNGAANATITGLKDGVNARDAVTKSQLDALAASISGGLNYKGLFDAATPSPDLRTQANIKGDFYKVSVAGTFLSIELKVGDMIIINKASAVGAIVAADIDKIDNTESADLLRQADIINALTSSATDKVLSAAQGKILKDAADAETAARISADSTLQTNIGTEASARNAADLALGIRIDDETAARVAADITHTSAIANEVAARQAADATLSAAITAEETARIAADAALQAQISAIPTDVFEEAPVVTAGAAAVSALAHNPIVGTTRVYLNGIRQRMGAANDYTVVGAIITFAFTLQASDVVVVDYRY